MILGELWDSTALSLSMIAGAEEPVVVNFPEHMKPK